VNLARDHYEVASVANVLVCWVVGSLMSMSLQTKLRLGGMTYKVSPLGRETYPFTEIYVQRLYERLAEFVAGDSWLVIDAGASVGIFAAQQASRGARVFAFEPNPHSFVRLKYMIEANGLECRVEALPLALGSATGTAILRVPRSQLAGSTMGFAPIRAIAYYEVDVVTLDDVCARLGAPQIDLLKIDVEGAEVDLLRGADNALRSVHRIALEYHSYALFAEARQILETAGFSIRWCRDTRAGIGIGVALFARV
jgi:FkbM family methyltransferase